MSNSISKQPQPDTVVISVRLPRAAYTALAARPGCLNANGKKFICDALGLDPEELKIKAKAERMARRRASRALKAKAAKDVDPLAA